MKAAESPIGNLDLSAETIASLANEQQRREFLASLDVAEAEGERDGFLTVEEVMQDLDATIEAASHASK